MASEKKLRPGRFWLRLAVTYLALVVLWPLMRPFHDHVLGRLAALLVPVLAVEKTEVRGVTAGDELWFYLTVYSAVEQKISNVDYHLDAHQYGYGHIIFTALAVAAPGWILRRRLARWLIGAAMLEAFFVFMVLANLFSVVGTQGLETWRGDLLTKLVPAELFLKHRGFIALVTANLAPAVAWLGLYVFPLYGTLFRSRKAAVADDAKPAVKARPPLGD